MMTQLNLNKKENVVTLVDHDVVNLKDSVLLSNCFYFIPTIYSFCLQDHIVWIIFFPDKSSQSENFNELYDLVQSAIDENKVVIFYLVFSNNRFKQKVISTHRILVNYNSQFYIILSSLLLRLLLYVS